jgi:alkanesulfonate monooxygenase SsuD/methylene tetrahydromethanopterin reductase-like flavin-dependent oxidoreductase (luciferase family)
MGLDWVHPEPTIRESILVFRQLLKGEQINFEGKMVTAKGNQIWFTPPPEIPLYIGCQRKWLLRLAGEITNGVIIDSATPNFASWALEQLKEGASRVDRDLDTEIENGSFWFQTVLPLSISEDREIAFDRVRNSMPFSLQTMSQKRQELSGMSPEFVKKVQTLVAVQTPEAVQNAKELFTNNIIQKLAPAGNPDDVIRFLKRLVEKGYNGVCFHIQTKLGRGGDETLQLFADHVMSNFQ